MHSSTSSAYFAFLYFAFMDGSASAKKFRGLNSTTTQLLAWLLFYLFFLLYMMQKWEHPGFSFWSSTTSTIFYAIAVYANANYLIPAFYKRGKKSMYFAMAVAFLVLLLAMRVGLEYAFMFSLHPNLYGLTFYHFSFDFFTNLLAFLFGILMHIAFDYIKLLKKQDELKTRQAATELSLLKSQVQPHFLFNTLNNIYYLAYTKNEKTAAVISKLSEIMRYFVDEVPKEKVPLSVEIQFLQNYIDLEQIRMQHPARLSFDIQVPDVQVMIPPMLLIPLVENIFKHGIDKIFEDNPVDIVLEHRNGQLVFKTCNKLVKKDTPDKSQVGLANLRNRLQLLFDNNFTLVTTKNNGAFNAMLTFSV